jgi:hypothetical protein
MSTTRVSTATRLVELARARWRFATTTTDQPVAIDLIDAEAIVRLESAAFRSVLAAMFNDVVDAVPSQEQLRDATTVLTGIADTERIDDPWPPAPLAESETTLAETYEDVPYEPGADLLDEVRTFATRYIVFAAGAQSDAFALWSAHTYCIEAFESTPRLAMLSPEKRSGKTRAEEVLELLVARPRRCTSMSSAYMFRIIEEERPTLLLDEIDAVFGPKTGDNHEDLRALVNSGHRRGATVGRIVGDGAEMRPQDFSVFSPVALAGLGELPETIADRSIVLRMRRRAADEPIAPFRWKAARAASTPLRRRLEAWAHRCIDELTTAEPAMPPGLRDRSADVWEPLLAIADAAGGHWPARARAAAVELLGGIDDTSIGVSLLGAIRSVFTDLDAARIPTTLLVARLNDDEAAPWGTWNRGAGLNQADLAKRLKAHGIRPAKYRLHPGDPRPEGLAGETVRGYERDHFDDAFTRYLAAPPGNGGTAGTPEHDGKGTPEPLQDNGCSTVPAVPPNGEDGASAPGDWTDELRAAIADADQYEPIPDDELLDLDDRVIQQLEEELGAEIVDDTEPPPPTDDDPPSGMGAFADEELPA